MSILLSDLRSKLRSLVNDFTLTGRDLYTCGSSSVFTPTEENVISITDVSRNDVSSGVTYTYSTSKNQVTISSSLTTGDTVELQYTYYSNYSDTELDEYLKASAVQLSVNGYTEYLIDATTGQIEPEPDPKDVNVLCIVAAILLKPGNTTIRMPDLTIAAPSDLPTDQKIARIIGIAKKSQTGTFLI